MKAHDLAKKLLAGPDLPITVCDEFGDHIVKRLELTQRPEVPTVYGNGERNPDRRRFPHRVIRLHG